MNLRNDSPVGLLCGVLVVAASVVGCGQGTNTASTTPASGAGQPASSGEPPAAPQTAAPDVTASDTSVDIGQVRVMLSVPQRPIAPMEKERFCVRAEIDGIPVDLAEGHIAFDMDMPMGEHRYALVESGDGCHSADVVLPSSPNGGTRWYATVQGEVDEQPITARFQFDVTKGATAR